MLADGEDAAWFVDRKKFEVVMAKNLEDLEARQKLRAINKKRHDEMMLKLPKPPNGSMTRTMLIGNRTSRFQTKQH